MEKETAATEDKTDVFIACGSTSGFCGTHMIPAARMEMKKSKHVSSPIDRKSLNFRGGKTISSGTKKISETNTKILPRKYIELHERFGVWELYCVSASYI